MIVIRNGLLIDPAAGLEGDYTLLVAGEKIKEVLPAAAPIPAGAQVLDAKGCWVLPGLIDLHVHLREPGYEWKETVLTGARAAVAGGFSSICCMPNTRPVNDCAEITGAIVDKAREAALARVYPIGAVTLKSEGKVLAPFSELGRAGCVAFSDDGQPVYDAGVMRRALEWCLMSGAVIACHEEDKCLSCGGSMNESELSLRMGLGGMPTVAEDVMVARDIELARYTGGRVHICHVSSARSVELIRRAKADGIAVTAEVTPHHLVLTEAAVGEYDTNAKMSPPLRKAEDVAALRQGLGDGTIDAVASDHAPHETDSKLVEFDRAAFGILGLQTSLPLLLELVADGVLERRRAVALLTSGAARCFGLPGGTLSPGAGADVVIVDPEKSWRFTEELVLSKSQNSPFLGRDLKGQARDLLVGGRIVLLNGELQEL